jgi:hypothetical protein
MVHMPNEEPRVLNWEKAEGDGSMPPVALAAAAPRPVRKLLPSSDIAIITLIALGFVAVGLLISEITGIPFTVPQPGKIPGLDANYWTPPIIAIASYLVLQLAARALSAEKRSWRDFARHGVQDYFLLGLFILVIYVHFNIKMWVPVINPRLYDHDYFAIDQALRPIIDLFVFLRQGVARVLPAVDIWYQAAFFAIFVLSFLAHSMGRRRWHYHNMVGLLLIEIVGPLTYLIAPAVGPFIYEQGPNALATNAELAMYDVYRQVQEGGAAWIAQHGGQYFAEPLAAMPSLHVGASFVIVYYAFRARLWVAPLIALTFFWIFIESVVARWHYLIDLPAGLLLAAAVIAVTNHLCRGRFVPDMPRKDADGAYARDA